MSPDQVIEEVKASGLRGRGGAGFPTGNKWGFITKAPGAKYVAVNADESEPGTFKDRELIEVEPHRVLEGVALCCYAIGAETAFIYIRGEYVCAADRLEAAIAEAEADGVLGAGCLGTSVNVSILVFRGAGAYICGEETALLESLEGRRPMPRSRPPILTADKLDTKLDYDSVQAAGSMLGSASLVVLDEDTCIVRAAALMEEFFRHESCGKCTPCREGTSWLVKILSRIEAGRGAPADLDLLLSLSGEISGKVLCALGDFATSPVVATVKQYRDEYERHIELGACPFEPW